MVRVSVPCVEGRFEQAATAEPGSSVYNKEPPAMAEVRPKNRILMLLVIFFIIFEIIILMVSRRS